MKNDQSENRPKKSTALLLISIFLVFNAALMFRAGMNTLYFKKNISSDYVPVEATVKELKPDANVKPGAPPRIIPVFSFRYNGQELTREAPELTFGMGITGRAFKQGETCTLWVHKNRGELMIPPRAGLRETGRSQLIISGISLLFAAVIWIVRGRTGRKAADRDHKSHDETS